jgi:acetoin:2,6-dichlorophenolindophenol oxidoreductase subunit alpha
MTHRVVMPDLGQTVAEGKIIRWLKKPGDRVARGDVLLEVETDKVTMEVESYTAGYLRVLLVEEGHMAGALAPIAILTDAPDEPSELAGATGGYSPVGERAAITTPSSADSRSATSSPFLMSEALPPSEPELSNDRKLAMYRRMLLCRAFEERVYYLFLEGRLPGTIHQSQGQEASAVGVCSALQPGDIITSTHRPHAHAIARGVAVRSLMAELFAKTTGCCRGKGGSMHVGDLDAGMLPAIAIVGGGIPLATGYALAFKHLKQPNIVACFFGEGAANIGTFHEAVNMAAIWDLPVVFVCENNRYAASTAVEKVMKIKHVSDRARAYGIPGVTVDGNDVDRTYQAMHRAAERARGGQGPTLLELETYRFAGHSRSDPGHYRAAEEIAAWKSRDPIARYEKQLLMEGLLRPEDVGELRSAIDRELEEAVLLADREPDPKPEDCLDDVFTSQGGL